MRARLCTHWSGNLDLPGPEVRGCLPFTDIAETLGYQPIYAATEAPEDRTVAGAELLHRCVGNGKQSAPIEDLKMFAQKAPKDYKIYVAYQIEFLERAKEGGLLDSVPYVSVNWYDYLFKDEAFMKACNEGLLGLYIQKLDDKLAIEIMEAKDMEPTASGHSLGEHPVMNIVGALRAFQESHPAVKLHIDDLSTIKMLGEVLQLKHEGLHIYGFKLDAKLLEGIFQTSHKANNPQTPPHIPGGKNEWIASSDRMFSNKR